MDQLSYVKYDNLLMDNSITIDLTTDEYNKYRLNPQALSNTLYGTPNLDHLILYLNRTNEFEFDIKRVRLLNYSSINDILRTILTHEEENINKSISNNKG